MADLTPGERAALFLQLGEQLVEAVKETGLLKPKRRKMKKRRARKAKAEKAEKAAPKRNMKPAPRPNGRDDRDDELQELED